VQRLERELTGDMLKIGSVDRDGRALVSAFGQVLLGPDLGPRILAWALAHYGDLVPVLEAA
jgi:hypothetical protein